jgi:hypothetical protein
MNERKVAILALAAALLVPAPRGLAAQLVSRMEAGQYTVSDGVLPFSTMRFAPSFDFDTPRAHVSARGSAFVSEQNLQLADGIVSGTFTSPTVYGVRAEMIGNASRAVDDRSLGNDQVDVQTRVHVLFHQAGGMWFGGGVARPWRIAVISSAEVADAGAWTKIGDAAAKFGTATMTATFTNFSFSKSASVRDTSNASLSCGAAPIAGLAAGDLRAAFTESASGSSCERQSRFSDLEGGVHWEVGPLEMSAQTGYRFGDAYDVSPDSRRWSAASATVWLSDRIAIVGGGGRQPALPLRGIPARSYGMAGLEVAYTPLKSAVPVTPMHAVPVKTFEMQRATSDMQKIVIRVGGVETVDVMGDFSDWSPLTLVRRGRDLWELTVPLSPGMYHINVRTDGGPWMAPPGVPTMHDSFSGDVGLIVVQPSKS